MGEAHIMEPARTMSGFEYRALCFGRSNQGWIGWLVGRCLLHSYNNRVSAYMSLSSLPRCHMIHCRCFANSRLIVVAALKEVNLAGQDPVGQSVLLGDAPGPQSWTEVL